TRRRQLLAPVTDQDAVLAPVTDQDPVSSNTRCPRPRRNTVPARTPTGHLPGRLHTAHLPAGNMCRLPACVERSILRNARPPSRRFPPPWTVERLGRLT